MEEVFTLFFAVLLIALFSWIGYDAGYDDAILDKGRAACEQSCSPRKPVFADGLCGCVEAP
jgi:hypothetical protein